MMHDHSFSPVPPGAADPSAADPAGRAAPAVADTPSATRFAAAGEPLFTLPPLRPQRDLAGTAAVAQLGPPMVLMGPGCALAAELASMIADQQLRHGHTMESDDAQDLHKFAQRSVRLNRSLIEYASLHHLTGARTYALKLAAWALAFAASADRRLAASLPEGTSHG